MKNDHDASISVLTVLRTAGRVLSRLLVSSMGKPSMSRKPCSVPTCDRERPYHQLFCWHHWDMLPRALQHRISNEWHPGKRNYKMNPKVREAVAVAVQFISGREQ